MYKIKNQKKTVSYGTLHFIFKFLLCFNNNISRELKSNTNLEKQRECEKKALTIVIELIDGELDEDILLKKVIPNILILILIINNDKLQII